MELTYQALLDSLLKMTPDQLAMPVVVFDADNNEMQTIEDIAVTGQEDDQDIRPDEGVLDDGVPYLLTGL